jgi:uridylate kinase
MPSTGRPAKIDRILLKLSGESLARQGELGLDTDAIAKIAEQVRLVHKAGVEIAIVVGGGNFIRGAHLARMGTTRATADQMGMLATAINCLALQDALERIGVDTRATSAVEMNAVMEPYIRRRLVRHLEKGRVVLLAGGTGNPFFTTDSAAALRAAELDVDLILKATKVDGVYSADPKHDTSAVKIPHLTFKQALDRDLQVMDRAAFALCMENDVPVLVFDVFVDGNLARAVRGEDIGTWVTAS